MKRWHDEILELLTNKVATPQPALISFVKQQMVPTADSIQATPDDNAAIVLHFSEWCVLFDYVMQGPRSASKFSKADRMVWPVGVSVFATRPSCGGNAALQTKVVVHCPVWNPNAIACCHDIWLSQKQSYKGLEGAPTNFSWLPSEGDIDGFLPDDNIGILTPFDEGNSRTFCATQALTRNDDYIKAIGRPDSCLSILPALDCPIYGYLVNQMVRSSSHHAWILEEQARGYGKRSMLCFFDRNPKFSGALDVNQSRASLVSRIFRLMKAREASTVNKR